MIVNRCARVVPTSHHGRRGWHVQKLTTCRLTKHVQSNLNVSALPPLLDTASLATIIQHDVDAAMVIGVEWGVLIGRASALVHPAAEFLLLSTSLYAAYTGLQWRRTRESGEELRALKASGEGGASEQERAVLVEKRKALLQGGYRDKHAVSGSIILAVGVCAALGGCVNTYLRTGQLFPGPHLFTGAGMVAVWAVAAALVPAMQKGDDTARTAHITLNAINLLLFLTQVPTGLEILGKVLQSDM